MVAMTLDNTGPRGCAVSPRVAIVSILCFWIAYFVIATVRWLMIDSGHQIEMLAARSLVTIGSMVATFIVYLAMRPLAGKSLAINVTAVALLSVPAAVAYSSMNWMAFAQVNRQIEARDKALHPNRIVIDTRGVEAARLQALKAIAAARATIKQANEQAKEAARAKAAAKEATRDARRAVAASRNDEAAITEDSGETGHSARDAAREAARDAARDAAEAKREAAQAKREAALEAAQAQREGWDEYRRGMQQAREAVEEARRHGVKIDLDEIMSGIAVPPKPPTMRSIPPVPPARAVPAAPASPVVRAAPRIVTAPVVVPPPSAPSEPPPVIPQLGSGAVMIQVGGPPNTYEEHEKSIPSQIADQALNGYFFFAAWGALFLALSYAAAVRVAEREAAGYRAAARDAELRALRYQVNPHFLFNTLNSLSTLILKDERDKAESMILNLSTFFRTSLTADPTEDVLLSEEIRLQRLYLDIEAVRFPERLKVAITVPPSLSNACVPCLILQPLVENALKYGVSRTKRPVTVYISAREDSHGLVLSVEDDGDAFPEGEKPAGTGVGLKNVIDRLKARFGDEASCRHGPLPQGGYAVTLFLPLVRSGC